MTNRNRPAAQLAPARLIALDQSRSGGAVCTGPIHTVVKLPHELAG